MIQLGVRINLTGQLEPIGNRFFAEYVREVGVCAGLVDDIPLRNSPLETAGEILDMVIDALGESRFIQFAQVCGVLLVPAWPHQHIATYLQAVFFQPIHGLQRILF